MSELAQIATPLQRYVCPDAFLDAVGDAKIVLLGEATHGTSEFYLMRAAITRRLIEERGFSAVALEADWPDAHRIDRFVSGDDERDDNARAALGDFQRFPAWMWRNEEFVDFIEWMQAYNARSGASQASVFGLDLYSLHRSMERVVQYLEGVDPQLASRARERYACFDPSGGRGEVYGSYAAFDFDEGCRRAVEAQIDELRREAESLANRDGRAARDAYFYAEQNALLVRDAELYYRAVYSGRIDSWNVRDTHMADTLDRLLTFLASNGRNDKVIVWAHNSHVGDASATEMGARGETNVGELVRLRHRNAAFSAGFTTYDGSVIAARTWDGPHMIRSVRPALAGSHEAFFHEQLNGANAMVLPRDASPQLKAAWDEREERAIGVIYRPETERQSHYFRARLAAQFDAVLHFDRTRHVQPLDKAEVIGGEILPETYPSAL